MQNRNTGPQRTHQTEERCSQNVTNYLSATSQTEVQVQFEILSDIGLMDSA